MDRTIVVQPCDRPPRRDPWNTRDQNTRDQTTTMQDPAQSKSLDIKQILSPPEPTPMDSFGQQFGSKAVQRASMQKPAPSSEPLSPPISPFTKASNTINPANSITVASHDPVLYPSSESAAPSPPRPLFNSSPQGDSLDRLLDRYKTKQAVDDHVATRDNHMFREVSPPHSDDYELAIYFKSEVMKRFQANPRAWLQQSRKQLLDDRKAQAQAQAGASHQQQDHHHHHHHQQRQQHQHRRKLPSIQPAHKSLRPIAASRVNKPDKSHGPRVAPARIAPQQLQRFDRPGDDNSARPSSSSATAAPTLAPAPAPAPEARQRTSAPSREDKDFQSLPDFCPPLDTLPANKSNSLKVEWKGNPLDVSHDPYNFLLHPDEQLLAASLRLDCATYLTSKRRIFESRLRCYGTGKAFRKTDAQQACKIDVNKASKLWTAFDKVGWLDSRHMHRFAHLV